MYMFAVELANAVLHQEYPAIVLRELKVRIIIKKSLTDESSREGLALGPQ